MAESPVILLIIVATCAVSMMAFNRPDIEQRFIFRPESILADKEYYRVVTCAFLHAGWGHLLLNMYGLYFLGGIVAWAYGHGNFILIYFGSVIGGSLLSLYIHRHQDYAAYGASGGVCGVLFAYVLKFPNSHLALFPLPYALPAWLYAVVFMLASFYALTAARDNIGHDAHLGGAIIGLLVAAQLQPQLVRRHGFMFLALLGIGGLVFAYVAFNPLFLPLETWVKSISWPAGKGRFPTPARRTSAAPRNRPPPARVRPPLLQMQPPQDWLIAEIEKQVGPLRKDEAHHHDWIDKFDRTYRRARA